jgi:hypothetical protein
MAISVPSDCVAACNCDEHSFAMNQMDNMLKADLSRSDEVDLGAALKNA